MRMRTVNRSTSFKSRRYVSKKEFEYRQERRKRNRLQKDARKINRK